MQKYFGVSHIVRGELDIGLYQAGERGGGIDTALCIAGLVGNYGFSVDSVELCEWKLREYVGFMWSVHARAGFQGRLHQFRWSRVPVPSWRLHGLSERSDVCHLRR